MKQLILLVFLFLLSSLTYEAPTLEECRRRTGINFRSCHNGLVSRKCDEDCNCPCPPQFPFIRISEKGNCPERFVKICPSSNNCICMYNR